MVPGIAEAPEALNKTLSGLRELLGQCVTLEWLPF